MLLPPVNSAYYRLGFPCFVGMYLHLSVALQGQISLHKDGRPTTKTTKCEIFLCVVLYSARSWQISQEKQVGDELVLLLRPLIQFFNAIVSCLISIKTIKSQKCLGLCPLKVHQGSVPDPKLQLRWLRNRLFLYKTQSSSTKRTSVKVLE